jgi:hypothetical protein
MEWKWGGIEGNNNKYEEKKKERKEGRMRMERKMNGTKK